MVLCRLAVCPRAISAHGPGSRQTRDPLQIQVVTDTLYQQFEEHFLWHFPSRWRGFVLYCGQRCLKCSAHSSGCVRHPRACPQTSSGASRWHLGTRSRVLSACRTNPSVAGTSKWCPTCKPSCPPVRGLFFQKGHVFHCSSHCQGDRAPLAFFKPKCLGCWQHEAWAFSEISWVDGELQ